ncbi:hypothetical protein D9619_008949 [Psilocybe cf. subviscida]|uniref:RlpA-like protein double-psi beta-barrel domain-containing protein n=1 Tax=Psilocybe cf. subviscida TaxID=2480587 RepID=A0A8H5BUX4_9AGAR|nr:hypothetical protein D9619_008949 [Psilocybe cf. subviscida]
MHLLTTLISLSFAYGMTSASLVGDATFFNPALGACGQVNGDNDLIVALSLDQFGTGSNCGRSIVANFQGASVVATVVDKCVGCASSDIDLSPAAFSQLASTDLGRIHGVSWDFI